MDKNQKIIYGILVILILGALAYIIYRMQIVEPPTHIQTQANTTIPATTTTPSISKIIDSAYVDVDDFIVQHPNLTSAQITMIKKNSSYEEFNSASADNIAQLSVLNNPANNLEFYFDNDAIRDYPNVDTQKNEKSVYEISLLNVKTGSVKSIYKSAPNSDRYLVQGIENNTLILYKTDFMSSPGPCFNPWISYYEKPGDIDPMVYLDLTNPKAGLKTYKISTDKYTLETERFKKCGVDGYYP